MEAFVELGRVYLITFGWAVGGSVSMGVGILIALKLFAVSTRRIDEWEEIKKGNMAMATILAALVVALGIVVASITRTQ